MTAIVRIIQNVGSANQDIGQTLPMPLAEAQRIARLEQLRNRPGVVVEVRVAA